MLFSKINNEFNENYLVFEERFFRYTVPLELKCCYAKQILGFIGLIKLKKAVFIPDYEKMTVLQVTSFINNTV